MFNISFFMPIIVLRKLLPVKCFCITFITIFICQGCAVIGKVKGYEQQGQTEKQILIAQAPTPSVQPVVEQPKATETGQGANDKTEITIKDARSSVLEWAAIILNFLLLLVVGYQAYTYKQQLGEMRAERQVISKQADVMRGQLDIMRETQKSFAVGERAYLIIEDVAFISKGEHPRVVFTLFNGGRTPAFEVNSDTEASLGVEPLTDKLQSFGHPYGEKVSLPAGTRKQAEASFPHFTMTAAQWQAVDARAVTFFVRGLVYYKDFQDIERVLPFCVGYDPFLDRFREYKAEEYSTEKPNQNPTSD